MSILGVATTQSGKCTKRPKIQAQLQETARREISAVWSADVIQAEVPDDISYALDVVGEFLVVNLVSLTDSLCVGLVWGWTGGERSG